jgi:predicted transglutaminase-like cysteine proteinase
MHGKLGLSALVMLLAAYGCAAPSAITSSIGTQAAQISVADAGAPLPSAKPMPDAKIAAPVPSGFISFCTRFPAQCTLSQNAPAVIALSAQQWLELQEINQTINLAIKPMDDQRHYGRAEYWNIPSDGFGDCEDYALTKRRDLIAAGLPAQALRMAVVVTAEGEGHAVLTVVTDHGDYVLDNLTNTIRSWDETGYRWIERQDPNNAWGWVSLDGSNNPAMAAIAASPLGAIRGAIR